MDYYGIVGMVVICLIALAGFYQSQKSSIRQDQKQTNELIIAIEKLTAEIKIMGREGQVRDKRLDKHGHEIDELKNKVVDHDHILANHEARLCGYAEDIKQLKN